jgi:gamma-glutamyltranspeptidase/glutathione hydrolase
MQPQGHFQVMSAMLDDGLDPQAALDRPRWQIAGGRADGDLWMEDGYPVKTMAQLAAMGHKIHPISGSARVAFGRGQIIRRDAYTGVLTGGSEPRTDGQIAAF